MLDHPGLQSAVYCGVPDANTAFRIAQGVLSELDFRARWRWRVMTAFGPPRLERRVARD